MQKVLCASGFRPADQVEEIARALYDHGVWLDETLVIHIGCFGDRHNSGLARSHPSVPQLIWHREVLPFVYRRFDEYKLEKQMHHQWDEDPRQLFAAAGKVANADEFVASVEVVDKL